MAKTTNICIWGDSISYGAWSTEGGWADLLRQHLHARTLASDFAEYFFVYNLGIPGDKVGDVLDRIEIERVARKPDVVLFAVGTNDTASEQVQDNPRTDFDNFEQQYRTLIRMAGVAPKKILVVGLCRVQEEKTTPFDSPRKPVYYVNDVIERYDTLLEKICEEEGVHYLPMHTFSLEKIPDGIHPNDDGHRELCERIELALKEHALL